ncbi:MAG: hypothetical protein NVS2B7_17440 [Herpetosiphon sp.]
MQDDIFQRGEIQPLDSTTNKNSIMSRLGEPYGKISVPLAWRQVEFCKAPKA